MIGLSFGSADRRVMVPRLLRLQQYRRHHDGVTVVRVADALLEIRGGRENQLQIGQFEVRAAPDEPVRLPHVRGQHAAPSHEVVHQLQRLLGGEQRVVGNVEPQRHDQVVEQVAADVRRVGHHVDTVLGELVAIADARQHQQLRAVDRAPAQHHLAAGLDDAAGAKLLEFHTGGALSVEDHPRGGGFGVQRQIRAAAARV